jgi:hypothetical protein
LKVHLGRLASLELVWAHRGPHGAYFYELAWDGQTDESTPHLTGLIDPDQLDHADQLAGELQDADALRGGGGARGEAGQDYVPDRSGSVDDRSVDGRPLVGGLSPHGRVHVSTAVAGAGRG